MYDISSLFSLLIRNIKGDLCAMQVAIHPSSRHTRTTTTTDEG